MRFLISLLLLCITSISFSKTQLIALPSQNEQALINIINSATNLIQITIYGFTDEKIAQALIQKQKNGVNVKILIEEQPYKANDENKKIINKLKNHDIKIHYTSKKFSLTHQKTILIDNQRAIILTDNFTYSGFHFQRNFILETDDTTIVKDLTRLFSADWNQTNYSLSKNPALVISPENSWKILNNLIRHTQKELDIYAAALTDKRIVHALLKQSDATIRIIISRNTKVFAKKSLCQHHIQIHYLKEIDQHAKALLRDYGQHNAFAYVGSANLTYPSLSKNREVGMTFSDKDAINKLHATFETDWKNSQSVCPILRAVIQ